MKLSEFDYNIPEELIAKYPSEKRGDDRLLVLNKQRQTFEDKMFMDILDYFKRGDLLVVNDTKVLPARLFGTRKTGGKVEIFVIDRTKYPVEALVKPSKKIKEGEVIVLENGEEVIVHGRTDLGRFVEFKRPVNEVLEECGHVPLPPYIDRPDEDNDKQRYQTVFAKNIGATASPTASLHFTEDILEKLQDKGVGIAYVTLHVSYGTFAPVKEDNILDHHMHSEYYFIDKDQIKLINNARNEKRRIIAAGTTTLRVLETLADEFVNYVPQGFCYGGNLFQGFEGFTKLFIYPGYKFKMVDGLITNFHLPKSTLLMLVSAFAGKELIFDAYKYAIENKFKFFSYGDAMLII
ncbi:MAG: tRNA preQ1(34) S-adenosylmethionine ribosyltransferase-isomerase QueA [Candidatus Omnitrophica bacterium]|nr:tRNA preQ1(34) S-adenosylmethionine ribosyltransferase-isomerase QueA [Candidatus Omnitrophota bacterium]